MAALTTVSVIFFVELVRRLRNGPQQLGRHARRRPRSSANVPPLISMLARIGA
jgi:hypothetical protein